jgi:hypothetical protein
MIQVADMTGTRLPVVCRKSLSGAGKAVPAFPRMPVFTEEKDAVSSSGFPARVGCAFLKLEVSQ